MWSVLEGDTGNVLNQQLASALSTMGDAQYWEETISPSTIRTSLETADPSNTAHTQTLSRAMKWLLASISKGRNVSDFYPQVVKMVGVVNLEVRKLVYMYLVQYADHNATTRELSLLSINSFQRGLADPEAFIRALALRVLTSIRIADIVQIQILGVQKCARDHSPYVRKCAANALAKLAPRLQTTTNQQQLEHDDQEGQQMQVLLEIMQTLLQKDDSTMVLSSALIAFVELCPTRLELLHSCFHKLCHLLTDLDEWGQVVALEILARYCRAYFREPVAWKEGTAERIDRERRVRRTQQGIVMAAPSLSSGASSIDSSTGGANHGPLPTTLAQASASAGVTLPPRQNGPRKVKRRVVKKGFYSDEEDESTEEEVYTLAADPATTTATLSTAFREHHVDPAAAAARHSARPDVMQDMEDSELAPDHRALLQAAMPLLKSRNSGVVLAVCSLQYYCGVASVRVRAAMGKALVRIHRDRREIQYVVLQSIRHLAAECPSAFMPFLHDFFVQPARDPPFTRLIKLDLLTSLALEPAAIQSILKELSSYVKQQGDLEFCAAAIRAVGKVTEMARIVYDRHGANGNAVQERAEANRVALDCLHGLLLLTQTSPRLVGDAVRVMQVVLQMLRSDAGDHGDLMSVHDPNHVQDRALRRILVLLVYTLSEKTKDDEEETDSDEEEDENWVKWKTTCTKLPAPATSSALWIIGENLASSTSSSLFGKYSDKKQCKIRMEILRLLLRCFCELENCEKEQAIHFASKLLVSKKSDTEARFCEHILSMGRVDVNPDVRDQARFSSSILHAAVTLQHDTDTLEPAILSHHKWSVDDAKGIFLGTKPPASFLPIQDDFQSGASFRFGSLSSLVGHRARSAYLPLPKWATEDSPSSLRQEKPDEPRQNGGTIQSGGFYEDEDSSSDDSSSSSSSSSSGESSSGTSAEDSFSSSSSSSSEETEQGEQQDGMLLSMPQSSVAPPVPPSRPVNSSSDDDGSSSSSFSSESSSGESSQEQVHTSHAIGSLIPMGGGPMGSLAPTTFASVADDLKGLVIAPVPVDSTAQPTDANFERDSGEWIQLVRPDHTGGLSVQARYLRGATKRQQAQILGLTVDKPTVVCVQLCFENQQKTGNPFRRIRVLQRSSTSGSSAIRPTKMALPVEIAQLPPGKKTECVLGIDFSESSDRDGSMLARIDIKFGSGGIPLELKPSICDLFLPHPKISADEFDDQVNKMHGFNRVEASCTAGSLTSTMQNLMDVAALTPVGKKNWPLRYIGTLPASGDPVYIQVAETGKITICCSHALVPNSVMNIVKRALQS